MKRVIVDDLRLIKEELYEIWQLEGEVLVFRTSKEALSFLKSNSDTIDELYLDHDLGIVAGVEDTVMPVVDFLCDMAYNDSPLPIGTIYIHTSNPVGSHQMKSTLQYYGYKAIPIHAGEIFRYVI